MTDVRSELIKVGQEEFLKTIRILKDDGDAFSRLDDDPRYKVLSEDGKKLVKETVSYLATLVEKSILEMDKGK